MLWSIEVHALQSTQPIRGRYGCKKETYEETTREEKSLGKKEAGKQGQEASEEGCEKSSVEKNKALEAYSRQEGCVDPCTRGRVAPGGRSGPTARDSVTAHGSTGNAPRGNFRDPICHYRRSNKKGVDFIAGDRHPENSAQCALPLWERQEIQEVLRAIKGGVI